MNTRACAHAPTQTHAHPGTNVLVSHSTWSWRNRTSRFPGKQPRPRPCSVRAQNPPGRARSGSASRKHLGGSASVGYSWPRLLFKASPPFLSGQMSLHTPSLRLPDDHRIKTPRIKFPPSSHTISKNREERCLAGKKKCAWNSYRPKAFEHSQRPQMCPQRGPPVSPSAAWRKTSQLAFSSWSCPSG